MVSLRDGLKPLPPQCAHWGTSPRGGGRAAEGVGPYGHVPVS